MEPKRVMDGRKLKIAHVVAVFPPYWSGTGTVAFHNAKELARRGHEVHVYTSIVEGAPTFEAREGFAIHRLRPLFQIGNAPLLPELMRIKNFDLIHLHHPFIFGAELIWAVSKLRRIPFVITHHNDLIGEGFRRNLFWVYSNSLNRVALSGASKYAVVSVDHAIGCALNTRFKERWDDVIEVPNGVDIQLFNPQVDGKKIRDELSIKADSIVILFVGALDRAHYFKGLDHLLEAFSLVNSSNSCLVVVGDGELKDHYFHLAHKLGVQQRVKFIGSIQHNKTPKYYAASDLVVLPSRPPESFGVVLIEAMACGKPVIASDIPGVRIVVSDGETGLLTQPANITDLSNKLQLLIDNSRVRQLMGEAGYLKVKKYYTWDRVVDILEVIYRGVMTGIEHTEKITMDNSQRVGTKG